MVKILIVPSLYEDINKKFKNESVKVFEKIKSLEESPKKGKLLGCVGNVLVKELKYKSFRFYFTVDGFKLRVLSDYELADLLIRFVRISNKKQQSETIEEIKKILRIICPLGFK